MTAGASAGGQACNHVGPYTIESADKTNRPMVDMEFLGRFMVLGGWTDPSGNWAGSTGVLNIKNVAFMRGSAPSETGGGPPYANVGTNWWMTNPLYSNSLFQGTSQFYLDGSYQLCAPAGHHLFPSWATCACNMSNPAEFENNKCKVRTNSKVRCCCFSCV